LAKRTPGRRFPLVDVSIDPASLACENALVASFLDHTPTALAFGTSGLRGLVKDITDLEAYVNVRGALQYLVDSGDIRRDATVVIAGDFRPSTDRIMRACAHAIVDVGGQVENAGKIPTPALIAHCLSTKRAGVMVSGSHIPFDRNGIKINKSVGEVLKSDEPGISFEVERVRAAEYSRTPESSAFDAAGARKRPLELSPADHAAEEGYVRRFLGSFAPGGVSGLRVLVYQHSAVGRDLLPRILRELGADVCTGGRSDAFVPIDTENITDGQLDRLQELAVAAEADGAPLHAIVSTDGDSDRPLVAAVLPTAEADARGRRVRFLPGDLLGIVVAEYLNADAAVVPISASDAVERRMAERGVFLRKSRIGSPYVVSALDEIQRAGTYARIVGWEANGGFLTNSDIALASGTLPSLPTRDSTLPILANLFAAAEMRIGLGGLWSRLPRRFGRAGLIDEVPVAVSKAILDHVTPTNGPLEVDFGSTPMPAAACQDRKARLTRFFTSALGFDDIVRINVLDGVRISFKNGDVAHVRPSGNAPQLRIYAYSDSQARADQIVELAIKEPDGILRQLEKAFGA
jgi:phosphomannomutase